MSDFFPLPKVLFSVTAMDLSKLIKQLHSELADLDAAILNLERLQERRAPSVRSPRAQPQSREAQATSEPAGRREARRKDGNE